MLNKYKFLSKFDLLFSSSLPKVIPYKKAIKKLNNPKYCFLNFYYSENEKKVMKNINNINFIFYKEIVKKLNPNQTIIIVNNYHEVKYIYRYYYENNFNVILVRKNK